MIVTLVISLLSGLAASTALSPRCAMPTSENRPALTMQFTPSQPSQFPPTSTIYGAIMTSYFNVVDCRYVTVENVDNNPVQRGVFTAKTTVDVMTVYRVGCMPETAAITRRDYRGIEMSEAAHPTAAAVSLQISSSDDHNTKRTWEKSQGVHYMKKIATRLAAGIDPTNDNLTVRDFNFLRQCNTALFSLNLLDSGLPPNQTCEELQTAEISLKLADVLIDAKQAADIICYASLNGLFFGMSNEQLYADLVALEYAIQMRYESRTLPQICETLNYVPASMLGIDANGIRNEVCNGTGGIVPMSNSAFTSVPTMTGNSVSTTVPGFPTGISSSSWGTGTSGVHGTSGQALSSATSAAGTITPWFNTTVTATEAVTTMTRIPGSAGLEMPSVDAKIFYNPQQVRRAAIRRHDMAVP